MQDRSNTPANARAIAQRFAPKPSRREVIAGSAVAIVGLGAAAIDNEVTAAAPMSEPVREIRGYLANALRRYRERVATAAEFQAKFDALVKADSARAFALEDERNAQYPSADLENKAIAVRVKTPEDFAAKLQLFADYGAATGRFDFLEWYGENRLKTDIRRALRPRPFHPSTD